MVSKDRLLSLVTMEVIAKDATYSALRGYPPPSEGDRERLTLGKTLLDTTGVFELYLPGVRPADAKVISRATVDRVTGRVAVEVFLPFAE